MAANRITLTRVAVFVAAIALIVFAITGQAFLPGRPSKFNFNGLKNDMTPQQVERIMGKASREGRDYRYAGESKTLEWQVRNDFYFANFHDGRLIDKDYHRYHEPG